MIFLRKSRMHQIHWQSSIPKLAIPLKIHIGEFFCSGIFRLDGIFLKGKSNQNLGIH